MVNNKWGSHLPNGLLRDDSVFRMGLANFMLLHLQAELAKRAREASPEGIVEVRFYLERWSDWDPVAWADYCADEYTRDRGGWSLMSLGCHVTQANEQNLEAEGGGASYEWYTRINSWNLRWLVRFLERTGIPLAWCHHPAFAYGHSDDQNDYGFVGMELCRQAIEAHGVLDAHPYWFQNGQQRDKFYGHRFILAHELFPDKPIFCSEAGNFDVTRPTTPDEICDWFVSLYDFPYVLGGCPFIWEDPTGAHQQNDWSRNPAIAQRVRDAGKTEFRYNNNVVVVQKEEPNPMDEMTRILWDEWVRQGVTPNQEDGWWKYCLQVWKTQGRAIIPIYSRDGSFVNFDDPKYAVAYMLPVMLWAEKGVWVVHEGRPPF